MNLKTWHVIDKPAILDLKLIPPKLTQKYMSAVDRLSEIYQVSPYFVHTLAARKGTKAVYIALQKHGYRWSNRTWKN